MKLEDGEIVINDEGIFQQCPKCTKLVAKVIDGQSLLDLRNCMQGSINIQTGEQETFIICDICGLVL